VADHRRRRPDHRAHAGRRGHPGDLRPLPAADLRPGHGTQPLVLPRPCPRRADKRRISAVPARRRRHWPPRPPLPAPGRPAPCGSSGPARDIDAGHEGARQDRSGCTCMAEDCQFSAHGATQAQRAVETSCSCWRAWPGHTCSTADPRMTSAAGLEPPAGIPRPTRSPQLMACRIRREANRQSRAHPPVRRRDRLTHLSVTAGAASRSSWRTDRRPGLRLARSVTFRIQCRLATLRL